VEPRECRGKSFGQFSQCEAREDAGKSRRSISHGKMDLGSGGSLSG